MLAPGDFLTCLCLRRRHCSKAALSFGKQSAEFPPHRPPCRRHSDDPRHGDGRRTYRRQTNLCGRRRAHRTRCLYRRASLYRSQRRRPSQRLRACQRDLARRRHSRPCQRGENALFLPKAAAPHFNYVGDSILGHHVNLGAGTKLSNLGVLSAKDPRTGQRPTIKITVDGREYDTGLTKFGAILGDDVQTGCNAVLNPGCLIGPRSLIYANTSLRKGFYPADAPIKLRQTIETAPRRTN